MLLQLWIDAHPVLFRLAVLALWLPLAAAIVRQASRLRGRHASRRRAATPLDYRPRHERIDRFEPVWAPAALGRDVDGDTALVIDRTLAEVAG